jgi:CheY-like chemotaxis protein
MAKILVVDDESEVRRALVGIVKGAGHDTVEAYDGLGALDGVREHRPDLLMCDWMWPELFGGEVISTLRTDPAYAEFKHLPIIVVSDFADETSEKKFTQAGASAFVAKQDNLELLKDELLAQIQSLLGGAGSGTHPTPKVEPL